jgi:hypothetical protein
MNQSFGLLELAGLREFLQPIFMRHGFFYKFLPVLKGSTPFAVFLNIGIFDAVQHAKGAHMKNIYKKINRTKYSLGELVSIVGSCARDSRETIAAMVDLLESGRVVIRKNGQTRRVRIQHAR